ncbi:recombination regulator RecX [Limosilactobacillus mucosae]
MAKISKIEAQKRPGRYNIYLDGKYAFAVAESVLIKYRLMKGMELDQPQLKAMTNDDEIAKAYNKMLDYLSHQLRTEHDVYEKLRQLKTPEEYIEPVMQKLRGLHLLDDHEYAASYVRTVMNTELKGPQVIRQKLRQKQIGELDIDSALAQFTPALQQENATKLAKKLFKRYAKLPTRRQEEKVHQGLITNGYAADLFSEIKDSVMPQPDEEQQDELLAKEAVKAWRRYEKRAQTDYERRLKVKQALYRKGFDLDEVERWLNEHENV